MVQLDVLSAKVASEVSRSLALDLPERLVARILGSAGVLTVGEGRRLSLDSLDSLVEQYGEEVMQHASGDERPGGKYAAAMVIGAVVGFGLAVCYAML